MVLMWNNLKSLYRICCDGHPVKSLNVVLFNNSKIRFCGTDVKALQTVKIRRISRPSKRLSAGSFSLLAIPISAMGLGTWQIFRKFEKDKIIEELLAKTTQDTVDLPQDLEKLKDMEFCSVRVKGRFDHSREIYMGPRPLISEKFSFGASLLSSSKAGYLVVTPFILSDRNLTILVNRGFVPASKKFPETRPEGQITGEIELVGLVRNHENRKPLGKKNQPERGYWLYRDLQAMSAVTGADPVFIDAVASTTVPGGPIAGQTLVKFPNDHVSYIITWYSLGVISFYMWYVWMLKKLPYPKNFSYILKALTLKHLNKI